MHILILFFLFWGMMLLGLVGYTICAALYMARWYILGIILVVMVLIDIVSIKPVASAMLYTYPTLVSLWR